MCKSIAPNAIQILDYTHAKQHLYSFAKLKFGDNHCEVFPFIKEMKELLWNDKAGEVAQKMFGLAGDDKMLLREANFFKNNKRRMLYKTFQDKGLHVGSGAIESLAKRLTQGRIKGAGMRWNVKDVNPVLMFRAALFDKRLKAHSRYQREMEVEYFQKLAA